MAAKAFSLRDSCSSPGISYSSPATMTSLNGAESENADIRRMNTSALIGGSGGEGSDKEYRVQDISINET